MAVSCATWPPIFPGQGRGTIGAQTTKSIQPVALSTKLPRVLLTWTVAHCRVKRCPNDRYIEPLRRRRQAFGILEMRKAAYSRIRPLKSGEKHVLAVSQALPHFPSSNRFHSAPANRLSMHMHALYGWSPQQPALAQRGIYHNREGGEGICTAAPSLCDSLVMSLAAISLPSC